MTATDQSFTMEEGTSKLLEVSETEDEDSGGTLDISGRKDLTWIMKDYRGGPTTVEKRESSSNDVTVTDASTGAYKVKIQPSDTKGLASATIETQHHRVVLEDGSGNTNVLLEGTISIKPD